MEGAPGATLLAAPFDRRLTQRGGQSRYNGIAFRQGGTLAGKLSRILAILKKAPGQIVSAYRKGRSEAPAVPPPEALRQRQNPPAAGPPRKGSRPK
jgi:hypothetical protein